MRKLIYSLGIASFLTMMIFTVATSLTNPFYGMSEAAIAEASTTTTGTDTSGWDNVCCGSMCDVDYCLGSGTLKCCK